MGFARPGPLLLLCTVGPVLALLVGCDRGAESLPPPPPRPVVVQKIAQPTGSETRSFTGVIEASGVATLGFEVGGRITQLIAEEGQAYQKGDVLAQLDVSNFEAELRSAEASARQANEELKRVQQLFESDNASRADFDSAIAAQRSAAASLEVARKKVSDGTLTMPYDGVIEDVIADEQSVVGQGAQVLSVQGDGKMKIQFNVPAEVVSKINQGMSGYAKVGTLTGGRISAQVTKIYPQATKSGTYPVEMTFDDPPSDIRGGMDGEVELEFPNPRGGVLRVQIEAIVSEVSGSPFVWIATASESTAGEGTVRKRSIEIGEQRGDGEIEVLDGLAPGDLVVVRGVHRLSESQTVKIAE